MSSYIWVISFAPEITIKIRCNQLKNVLFKIEIKKRKRNLDVSDGLQDFHLPPVGTRSDEPRLSNVKAESQEESRWCLTEK